MRGQNEIVERDQPAGREGARERLLARIPVSGQQMDLAGVSTAVLRAVRARR